MLISETHCADNCITGEVEPYEPYWPDDLTLGAIFKRLQQEHGR